MSNTPRSYQRYNLDLAAIATISGAAIDGKLQNLSVGGALLVWQHTPTMRFGVGQRFELSFLIPQPEPVGIATTVTVRWTSPTGVGIQFDGLRAKEAFALGKYLASLPAATP